MGVYKAVIRKSYGSVGSVEQWTNVYHLNTPTIEDAAGIVETIANAEIAFCDQAVFFMVGKVSDPTKVEAPQTVDLGGVQGEQIFTGGVIPAWNVVSVLFTDASGGRPERKYYRVGLTEGAINGTRLESTYQAIVQGVIDTLTSTVIALCAPDGDSITGGVVMSLLGMRQQHWHRRSRPGFHRGYVPD